MPEAAEDIVYRRPTEDDHPIIVGVVDEWWGGRHVHEYLPRLWLQHFTGTSWVAEGPDGRLAGFLIGFISPDHPDRAHVHMIATDPNRRRRGIGRELVRRFSSDVAAAGVRRVTAVTWPGNRTSLSFHRGIGFRVDDGPGSTPIYGTPAFPDYDYDRDDRVVLILDL